MLNFLYLIALLLSIINFSGASLPGNIKIPVPTKSGIYDTKKEDDEIIPWMVDRRLSWDDFLCEPKRGTDAVASTSTALGIAYQVKNKSFTYQITCTFSKKRSWGLVKTPYILAHEQGHFDITEIYARKLHKTFKEYKFNPKTFKADVNDIYKKNLIEKEAFQKSYDGQTNHSRKKPQQLQWLQKIDSLLAGTEDYAEYPQ